MKFLNIIFSSLFLLPALPLAAQDDDNSVQQRYEEAYREYRNGQFDASEGHTLQLIPKAGGVLKRSAYRLLALCRLEKGDVAGARKYVEQLLDYDPYYTTTLGDPQRFADLIEEAKLEEMGITTASRQKETIDEAPVPVTLITEDMIRLSGASTLQELLCLYVPGMTMADGMTSNVAMHGIYSLSQEKILILLDGHRMNSYSSNSEDVGYRTSLDKIEHIEVLRGPASSLYGNIALTAVINIITRRGASLNGGQVSATVGTQKSLGGGMLLGGGNNVVDIMAWGNIFSTEGFRHEATSITGTPVTLYSHGYRDRPAYDVGIKGHWRDFTFSLTAQRAKEVPYVNVLQASAQQRLWSQQAEDGETYMYFSPEPGVYDAYTNYSYDKYPEVDGEKPGVTRINDNVTIDYSHSFGNIDLQASAFLNMEEVGIYNVIGDSVDVGIASVLMEAAGKTNAFTPFTQGCYVKLDWDCTTLGGQVHAMTNYELLGNGSILAGMQFENTSFSSASLVVGGNYSASQVYSTDAVFSTGSENTYSGYVQLKHYFTPRLIINAGLRYDHKVRFSGSRLNHLSPRLSMIYKFPSYISTRLSFNSSFVDAPYLYRACKISLFTGGADMEPEKMNSVQLGATYHRPNSPFTADVSAFYNVLRNIVTVDVARPNGNLFNNAAKIRQMGIEGSVQYTSSRFNLNGNATWQRVVESEYTPKGEGTEGKTYDDFTIYNGNTMGTPGFITNVMGAYCVYAGHGNGMLKGGKLWLRGNVSFQSDTYYRNIDMMASAIFTQNYSEIISVKPQCTLGIGATYAWKHLDIDLSLKNITNNEYKVGSALTYGIPRPGRQFLAKVTLKL